MQLIINQQEDTPISFDLYTRSLTNDGEHILIVANTLEKAASMNEILSFRDVPISNIQITSEDGDLILELDGLNGLLKTFEERLEGSGNYYGVTASIEL